MKIYYRGSEFEFICPDTFNEENTLQTFMLIDSSGSLDICYSKGYNKGWVKWYNIPKEQGHNGISLELLKEFLTNWYRGENINLDSIKFINPL